jgi:hypothetical protein
MVCGKDMETALIERSNREGSEGNQRQTMPASSHEIEDVLLRTREIRRERERERHENEEMRVSMSCEEDGCGSRSSQRL